jgi:hypothetical protein
LSLEVYSLRSFRRKQRVLISESGMQMQDEKVICFYFSMNYFISRLIISLMGSTDKFNSSLRYSIRDGLMILMIP